ncbi:hypothetical protein [Streptomyces mirabilis]|uniref:hypothetical protein n=1 Tax=Streptomyces mirabilis TaxID=68239 RepID=UPI0036CE3031
MPTAAPRFELRAPSLRLPRPFQLAAEKEPIVQVDGPSQSQRGISHVGVFPEVDDCLLDVLALFCLTQHFGRYRHVRDQGRCNTGVVRDLLKGYW